MDLLVKNFGVIGMSKDNGHPYSFSAIINGFNKTKFTSSGWDTIYEYMTNEPSSTLGIPGAKVTHAWTQDIFVTRKLAAATEIETVCSSLEQMINEVDAVIIARDDWKTHFEMSQPFLERGIPVFIDKPLTMSKTELKFFLPYIKSGKLMSCSGFRFASELRESIELHLEQNRIKHISGVVLNDLEKYGIHLLDPVMSMLSNPPKSIRVSRKHSLHDSYAFQFDEKLTFNLECLGSVNKIFNLNFYGQEKKYEINLSNNFGAFKNTLAKFLEMVNTEIPPIEVGETKAVISALQVAYSLSEGQSKVITFEECPYNTEED
jgi:hypothetical protein